MTQGLKIAVVGSRTFRDDRLLAKTLEAADPSLVISGGAKGADHLAERWARRNGVETQIFHPDHKRYRHPYHHRNRLIVEACDVLIAFWDGHSTGTKYTIDYARRMGKKVTVIRF
jgi:predicted Rossmann fold nucleotide-binding protein DprA/Smf involved in DNA uptake|nr:SLOG family protein [Neorhizobium tomejilense]